MYNVVWPTGIFINDQIVRWQHTVIDKIVIQKANLFSASKMHGKNGPKYGMLVYPDDPQEWFDFGNYWPNFGPPVDKKHSVIGVSGHSDEKFGMQVYHEYILNWFDFGAILALWWPKNLGKFGFPAITRRTHGRNDPKFGMQVYHDHRQNWCDFDHGLMKFLLWVLLT